MKKNTVASANSLFHFDVAEAPSDAAQAVLTVEQALTKYALLDNNALSQEDFELIACCLDTIGNEETTIANDGSLQGKGTVSFVAGDSHAAVEIVTDIEVKNIWDRSRREWACTMGVRRAAGKVNAEMLLFKFHFASFGASDEGSPIVLFDFTYERKMDDPRLIANFNKGAQVKMSEYDITSNVQWGYMIVAHCDIRFEDGAVISI